MKITSRNVSSYHDEFTKWLEQSEVKEKYTSNSFKAARDLRKKLVNWGMLKFFEDFFSASTDFLHSELQTGHERTLLNLNVLTTFLEGSFKGQHESLLALCMMELFKMCVPSLACVVTSLLASSFHFKRPDTDTRRFSCSTDKQWKEYALIHIHTHTYITYIHTFIHTQCIYMIHVYIYMHICTFTCTQLHIYTCNHVCVFVCVYLLD